ncbi:MAG TPA: tyrosine-type recombinase/integrase [Nitrosopumilaceae archaeon]|nr:tyrosine-type recombinase/integrase [Nitrosopumilaceae archaeon]
MTLELIDVSNKVESYLDRKFRYSKSYATRRTYKTAIQKFQEFLFIKYNLSLDEVLSKLESKQLDPLETLDQFFSFLSDFKTNRGSGRYSNASISLYITAVKEFLNSQNLHIYAEDLKQKFRFPRKEVIYEEGLTKEKIVRILHNSSPKLQTAILMCISSGIRLGEFVQLRISDIDFSTNPTTVHLRKETTKTRQTRLTHITAEATKSLKDYMRRTLGWSEGYATDKFLFLTNNRDYTDPVVYNRAVRTSCTSLQLSLLYVVRSIPELGQKNENGRNNVHFHAFRAWFKTQVTNAHQSDFAEALMGHQSVKLMYFRQNLKDRLKTYLEVESALTVSDLTTVENTVEGLLKKVEFLTTELEKVKQRCEVSDKYERINRN